MIIKSLLDLDFYKLTMGQLFYYKFKNDTIVEYRFKNRSKYSLKDINIDNINEELRLLTELRLDKSEISYLKRMEIFSDEYISFMSNLKMPLIYATLDTNGEPEIIYAR